MEFRFSKLYLLARIAFDARCVRMRNSYASYILSNCYVTLCIFHDEWCYTLAFTWIYYIYVRISRMHMALSQCYALFINTMGSAGLWCEQKQDSTVAATNGVFIFILGRVALNCVRLLYISRPVCRVESVGQFKVDGPEKIEWGIGLHDGLICFPYKIFANFFY